MIYGISRTALSFIEGVARSEAKKYGYTCVSVESREDFRTGEQCVRARWVGLTNRQVAANIKIQFAALKDEKSLIVDILHKLDGYFKDAYKQELNELEKQGMDYE